MVVALYVLTSRTPPAQMRAALTMFLFISMFTSLGHMLLYGVMTDVAFIRGTILIPVTLAGVLPWNVGVQTRMASLLQEILPVTSGRDLLSQSRRPRLR